MQRWRKRQAFLECIRGSLSVGCARRARPSLSLIPRIPCPVQHGHGAAGGRAAAARSRGAAGQAGRGSTGAKPAVPLCHDTAARAACCEGRAARSAVVPPPECLPLEVPSAVTNHFWPVGLYPLVSLQARGAELAEVRVIVGALDAERGSLQAELDRRAEAAAAGADALTAERQRADEAHRQAGEGAAGPRASSSVCTAPHRACHCHVLVVWFVVTKQL